MSVPPRATLGRAFWQTALVRCDLALAFLDEQGRAITELEEGLTVLRSALGDEHRYVRDIVERARQLHPLEFPGPGTELDD